MSPQKKVAIFSALIIAPLVLAIVWCILKGIREANISKVRSNTPPLTVGKVESLLGRPDRIEHSESTGLTGDAYYYKSYGNLRVIFVNGVEFQTNYAPDAKS